MSIPTVLRELQTVHDNLAVIQRDLTNFPSDLASVEADLKNTRKRLDDNAQTLEQLETKRLNLSKELDLAKSLEHSAKSAVKAAKQKIQYAAAIRDLDVRERERTGVAKPLKETEQRMAALQAENKDLRKKETTLQSSFDSLHTVFLSEHENQVVARERLTARKTELEKALGTTELNRFNRILQQRKGKALATVEGGACTGCRTKIRAMVLHDLKETGLVSCESCQRTSPSLEPMPTLPLRIEQLRARIRQACEACGRLPGSVELLPVSKRQPVALIQEAAALGFATFGENYVQEGMAKALACPDLSFVLLGPLQRNKAKQALQHFAEIMTVDRPELALRLRHLAAELGLARGIWIQMDLWGEATKQGGCSEADLPALIQSLEEDPILPLQGFMAIPPPETPEAFDDMARLRGIWQDKLGKRLRLSMGMSDDLEEAIQAGSDQVRIGTAFFGERTS